MKPNLALRIISIPSFIICCSIFIFKNFYLKEILFNVDLIENKEMEYFINICAICGINISILIFNASRLIEESARRMLKSTGLIFGIMFITLTITVITTAIRIPNYILFMTFIFGIFSYVSSRKTKN